VPYFGETEQNHYSVLRILRTATLAEIKTAYRKLSRIYAPDYNPGDATAENLYKQILYAYEVLSNPSKKADFDLKSAKTAGKPSQNRTQNTQKPSARPSPGPASTANEKGHERPGSTRAKGNIFIAPEIFEISITEALLGCERVHIYSGAPHFPKRFRSTLKVRPTTRPKNIQVLGKGYLSTTGGQPGDAYIQVKIKENIFKFAGDNITATLPISVMEALLGAQINVKDPFENTITVTIPPGCRNNHMIKIKGKGVPASLCSTTKKAGHLYFIVKVVTPSSSGAKKALLLKMEKELYGTLPRAHFQDN
jgi:DnaJ-class molecular chaperone